MRHQYSIAYTNVSISRRNNDCSDDLKGRRHLQGKKLMAFSIKKYVYLCELVTSVLKLLLISSIALKWFKGVTGYLR